MNAPSRPIRVGVIGAGTNTKSFHIPNLQAIAGVEIAAVANRSLESSRAVAAQFGIARAAGDWRELVAAPDIDAVVIGTWPDTHAEMTCAALAAGKHVLCEARMARNLAEARRMKAASEAAPRLVAQIVPAPFTFGFDATIARLVREGVLGDMLAIDVRVASGAFIDRAAPMRWRSETEIMGHNTMTMGIWYESLMRWVGEATHVSAMRRVFVKERNDPRTAQRVSVRMPDHVDVLAEMACGALANMRFSTVTGLAAERAGVWLYGSEGTLHVDQAADKLFVGRRGDTALTEQPIAEADAGRWQVEEDFVASIRTGAPVRLTSFDDGVKYMAFTEAVAVSGDSGQRVDIAAL